MRVQRNALLAPLLALLLLGGCGDDDDLSSSPSPIETPQSENTPTRPPDSLTPAQPTPGSPTPLSDADGDGFSPEDDCNDGDDSVYPGASEIPYDTIDQDCDGSDLLDVDGDGYSYPEDCNDQNVNTYPGATEFADGEDNDCDDWVDEDLLDADNDQDGFTDLEGDCDDSNPLMNPGQAEIPYDDVDQDCSGSDLKDVDMDGANGGTDGPDCDDTNSSISPSAQEVPYDGVDQDCNGTDLVDQDGDGYAGGPGGDDCNDLEPLIHPDTEEIPYDGIDQDCLEGDLIDVDGDGQAAEEMGGLDCNDQDASIYTEAVEMPYDQIDQDCSGGDLNDIDQDGFIAQVVGGDDCNDVNDAIYPGATEYANGIDDDCSGVADDHLDTTDDDGDSFSEATGDCDDEDPSAYPGGLEIPYDGIDQDCLDGDLIDVDLDGYAASEVGGSDCNDLDEWIRPQATEVPYDGVDQDCDGDDLEDVDLDGFTALEVGGPDCDDAEPLTYPGALEVPYDGIDQDCNGQDLLDADLDGFDAVAFGGTDCNDANPSIHPDAEEVCDGVDNDCDNTVDIDALDPQTFYWDGDHDGFGDPNQAVEACAPSQLLVEDATDCDDSTALTYPGAEEICDEADNNCDLEVDEGVQSTFYLDADHDWYGVPSSWVQACSAPEGYSANTTDCNDAVATTHPGAAESCNGVDDDCDVSVDEGVKTTFYFDADEDGYGNPTKTVQACTAPEGYVSNALDCKDTNDLINPAAAERCNGLDDDCDEQIDEDVNSTFYRDADGDGYGNPSSPLTDCNAPSGYVTDNTDCNDSSASVHPGALEVCNGVDEDCDSLVDDGVLTTWYRDEDRDGYGSSATTLVQCTQPTGYVSVSGDCKDTNDAIYPGAPEVCNSADDDCDGQKDEGVGSTWYYDGDGDGYGTSSSSTLACSQPAGYSSNALDCDDTKASVHPTAQETCNGIDDDCDGNRDESLLTNYYADADGDGYGNPSSSTQACNPPLNYVTNALDCLDSDPQVNPLATETCNGLDDNCDGTVDGNTTQCMSCTNGTCPITTVRDGSVSVGTDNKYQYSPVSTGAGYLEANWDGAYGATKYLVSIGTTSGGSDVASSVDVGALTYVTIQHLSLEGAWAGKTYYVTVTPVGANGNGRSTISNGVQIAEAEHWDGISTSLPFGVTTNWPEAGVNAFYGNHYFETVELASSTTVRVQGWGKVSDVPSGVGASDPAVTAPSDGWLAIYANTITIDGSVLASGRGYGGGGGGHSTCGTGAGGGKGGAGGLGGAGGISGGSCAYPTAGGGGGGSPGGVAYNFGGAGNLYGGGGGSSGQRGNEAGGAGGQAGGGPNPGLAGVADFVGGVGVTPSMNNARAGDGGLGELLAGGGGGAGAANASSAGGGGGGYGAGGGGGNENAGGGGGGGAGGTSAGTTGSSSSGANGAGPFAGTGGVATSCPAQPGLSGGYATPTGNGDSTTDRSLRLGSGGGGGGGDTGGQGAGGGGGAGGGALVLYAYHTLTITSSAHVLANGAGGGGAGRDDNSCRVGGVGGGGAGGGILLEARTISLHSAATSNLSARGAGGALNNGGTIKLFYNTFSGQKPNTNNAGRLYDAGSGSFR